MTLRRDSPGRLGLGAYELRVSRLRGFRSDIAIVNRKNISANTIHLRRDSPGRLARSSKEKIFLMLLPFFSSTAMDLINLLPASCGDSTFLHHFRETFHRRSFHWKAPGKRISNQQNNTEVVEKTIKSPR